MAASGKFWNAPAWAAITHDRNFIGLSFRRQRAQGSLFAQTLCMAIIKSIGLRRIMKRPSLAFCGAITLVALSFSHFAAAADFSGAGATFPYPLYARWAESYMEETGIGLSYQPIGSSGGLKAIAGRTVTFGATDVPLTAKELADGGNLIQWPMVMGGIVPVVNLEGISSNEITLDGDTLARIFLGEIKTWDDATLRKLNPELKLPSAAIVVVHRSDGSGTTFNFTNYLSKVSETWKTRIGSKTSVEWPVGAGAKGNEGVADKVQQTKGSLGYVEVAYAKLKKLTATKMINKDRKAVEANSASVRAAAANWWWSSLDWAKGDGMILTLTDQPGAAAWPISASTFILMPTEVKDAEAANEALRFFAWAYAHGDKAAVELDYVPMPLSVKQLVIYKWTAIKGPDGKTVYGGN
jgi:phosphate transport system substrate-binding protein